MRKDELIKSLARQGFDRNILAAFEKVERENFIPFELKKLAYEDKALPIGYRQTISQPFTIAFMLRLLEAAPGQKIMEVGSGSGYVLALLNELTERSDVYGVELIPELVERSREVLKEYDNIRIFQAAKTLGLPEQAPFDRILVSAAAKKIPSKLVGQLSKDGVLVCPVGNEIIKIKKEKSGFSKSSYYGFVFVPLVGLD